MAGRILRPVSTLLEVLLVHVVHAYYVAYVRFQPFLRFYPQLGEAGKGAPARSGVSTLLEILLYDVAEGLMAAYMFGFQPFLRFYIRRVTCFTVQRWRREFQPFLRFYRSCWAVFWVFKFFGSFLEPRRPPWECALHSKIAALGRGEAPFFGVAQRSCG